MLKKFIKPFPLLLLLLCTGAQAQTYLSPFSRFGVGELQSNALVRYKGMGGASIAAMDENTISLNNPASYAQVRSFCLETGATANFYQLKTAASQFRSQDFEIPYLAIALPLSSDTTRQWGLSFGLTPYSKIGYQIKNTNTSPVLSEEYFTGEGGLTRFYVGSSIKLFNNFYLGANAGYIFGKQRINHSIIFPDTATFFGVQKRTSNVMNGFAFDAGVIYRIKAGSRFNVQLGIKANLPASLKTNQIVEAVTFKSDTIADSIINSSMAKAKTDLPLSFGGGIQLQKLNGYQTEKWRLVADAEYQQWSKFAQADNYTLLSDQMTLSLGGQWTPSSKATQSKFRRYVGFMQYRAGFRYSQNFYSMNGSQVNDTRVTLGLGFPIPRKALPNEGTQMFRKEVKEFSYIDFSVELGQTGTVELHSVQQQYVIFSLGLHIFETDWFLRKKIE